MEHNHSYVERSLVPKRLHRTLHSARYGVLAGIAVLAFLPSPVRASGNGVFSIHCVPSIRSGIHISKDDPIVFPGQPGATHQHMFTGNTTTDANSTYDSMVNGSTSCKLPQDTSAYWAPTLLDGSGNVIRPRGWTAYYRGGADVVAFPADFRMITGFRTTQIGTKALGWSCDQNTSNATYYSDVTEVDCGSGWLKAHIHFPQWWDGVQTRSDDSSHLSWTKVGPYTIHLPNLSLHITFNVHSGAGLQLSSDAMNGTGPGGSLHADFWQTWDQSALQRLVDYCLHGGRSCVDLTTLP